MNNDADNFSRFVIGVLLGCGANLTVDATDDEIVGAIEAAANSGD